MPLTVLILLAITGCNSVGVQTFTDPRFEVPEAAKYTWDVGGNRVQGVKPANRTAMQAGLRRGITRELDARGWTLVDRASAEVLVRYWVGAHSERVATQTAVGKSSFGGDSTVATQQRLIREGAVAIDFIHPQAGVVMWRGSAEGTLDEVPDPDKAGELAERVSGRILQKLP